MSIDLDSMSRDELLALQKDVDKALNTLETRRKAEARRELEELAREKGFSLKDLVDGRAVAGKSKAAPKYANPDNPSQTWTGKGRQPNWFKAALDAGKSADDLAI